MTYRLVFRRAARQEFDAAADWYEREHAGLGLSFLAEIDQLLQHMADAPTSFPVVFGEVRRAVCGRFPYCVYFRLRDKQVVVLAIFHTARNPAVWQRRS